MAFEDQPVDNTTVYEMCGRFLADRKSAPFKNILEISPLLRYIVATPTKRKS